VLSLRQAFEHTGVTICDLWSSVRCPNVIPTMLGSLGALILATLVSG